MTQELTIFGIANCDTVKAARLWLNQHEVPHRFHDFKKQGIPAQELDGWLRQVGPDVLLNRKGSTWRSLDGTSRDSALNPTGLRALLLAHTSLIKRPVVRWPDGQLSVGFSASDWSARLGASST